MYLYRPGERGSSPIEDVLHMLTSASLNPLSAAHDTIDGTVAPRYSQEIVGPGTTRTA